MGWKITAPEVLVQNGGEHEGAHFTDMRRKYPGYSVLYIVQGNKDLRIAPQLLMSASSRRSAQNTFELLQSSFDILDGSDALEVTGALVVPADRSALEDLDEQDVVAASENLMARHNALLACRLASKLSRRSPLQYAAFKLRLSYRTAPSHHMEFHPRYSPKRFSVSTSRAAHVTLASAVTLAYSAIEELQLEPRSHGRRPIKKNGIWDDAAYRDLRSRLGSAGIRSQLPVTWIERGPLTRIHKADRAPPGAKLSWTRGQVRDKAVSVEDALLAASWLRSKCTTHKFGKATTSITMVDVFNVQSLARRLILERVELWDEMTHPS